MPQYIAADLTHRDDRATHPCQHGRLFLGLLVYQQKRAQSDWTAAIVTYCVNLGGNVPSWKPGPSDPPSLKCQTKEAEVPQVGTLALK